jgi:hypothetical protein
MLTDMDDRDVIGRIGDLVREEHQLRGRSGEEGLDEEARARLTELEASLDQCWDLLRQRRARHEYGENPDEAQPRSKGQVEGYLQ